MDARERLIESAQDLLWERGYTGVSPKAIQERAAAGQGSMYHHFAGKADLAEVAVERSAEQLRAQADSVLSGSGSALDRISAYLLRKREVLRGCRLGRLAQDPEIVASEQLRRPLDETFRWIRQRLAQLIAEGQANGELHRNLDADNTAATIIAVLQGGYVLARAANSQEPFNRAVKGVIGLLAAQTKS
jgi:TetR/AcrR family transcriptional repressor of nem operon